MDVHETLTTDHPRFVVIYGVGDGSQISALFNHPLSLEVRHVLVFEKDPSRFANALSGQDWEPILLDERFHFCIGISLDKMTDFLSPLFLVADRIEKFSTLKVFCDPENTHQAETADYYLSCARILNYVVQLSQASTTGFPEDSYRGFMNLIENLHQCRVPSFEILKNKFIGLPGIAVSTGPSLKYSFDFLRAAQNKAVIACSDSSLKILLNEGITPHFVGCIERVPETSLLFDQLPVLNNSYLVSAPFLWPETIKKYPGPRINMMRGVGQMPWFFPYCTMYQTGNSVSHLLYVLLHELGCQPIMLVGQDLSFDRHSHKSHVDGIPDLLYQVGQKQRQNSQMSVSENKSNLLNGNMVEGNNGEPILTMEYYNIFRRFFSWLFKLYPGVVYNVIPPDYGAKIEGATLMSPENAMGLLKSGHDIAAEIKKNLSKYDLMDPKYYKEFISEQYSAALNNLKDYQVLSLDILDAISSFVQKFNPEYFDDKTYRPFLTKIESVASRLCSERDLFFKNFLGPQIISQSTSILQQVNVFLMKDENSKDVITGKVRCSRLWFETLYNISSRMHRFMERNRDRIFAQLEPVLDEDHSCHQESL